MNRTPAQQWSALSALYEEADGLGARDLAAFLARLEGEGNELLPQLRRMLDARAHMETDDFLSTMPRLSTEAQAATSWSPGRRVGPYRLVKPLGEGGMAEVWLAERDDGAFKRQVAIKLPYPKPGRETFALRFDRERDILATLRHPNIAGLFDAGVTAEGQAWLALEYVEGQPISVFCDERRLSVRERVQLFRQVLLAVQHAHANLVIHRDLKPANILVTPQGEVRLLDFGIAKLLEAEGDAVDETELTRQAGRSMTPRYASPEQLMGVPLTTATDVYSLGVVFYELICGQRPYELKVESAAQLEHAILESEARPPSRRHLDLSLAAARGTSVGALRRILAPELDAIALRALEKSPKARYSSVDAVLADVDRWLSGEPVLARTPSAFYRFRKFAARHRLGVGLGVASVLGLAGATAVALVFAMQAREESARAAAARDFMLGLFERANEEKARGADLTARELLESGRKDAQTRIAGQPRLQAELLKGIGGIQMNMGEYADADSTLGEAAAHYQRLGMEDELALTRTMHADNAMRMANIELASARLKDAAALAASSRSQLLRGEQLKIRGWILAVSGDAIGAKQAFEEGHAALASALPASDSRVRNAVRGKIYTERLLRNHDRALELHRELEQSMSTAPAASVKELTHLQMDRAELLKESGRYADASAHVAVALPRCAMALGPHDEHCRRILLAKVHVLMRLGQLQDAAAELPRLDELIDDSRTPALQTDALFAAFRLQSLLGASSRLDGIRQRMVALSASGSSINPALKSRALLMLAESALISRRPDEAQAWIDRDKLLDGGSGKKVALLDGVQRSLGGVVHLAAGRPAQALGALEKADAVLTEALGKEHPLTVLFQLNQASALVAMGRLDEARTIVDRADPVLRRSFGAKSPAFREYEEFINSVHRAADGARTPAPGGQIIYFL